MIPNYIISFMCMKSLILSALLALLSPFVAFAQQDTVRHEVLFETTKGNIRVALYNETPLHRDNFLKLVKQGFYDGNLFHRVIADFMIQSGDSTSRSAKPGDSVGQGNVGYTIPAEIVYPKFFNKRGALAAAREADADNPERASSGSQFYIVYGTTYSELSLNRIQERIDETTNGSVKLTDEVRDYYRKFGGAPHLDGQYTVFGEVVDGIKVVRDINYVRTDDYDRPIDDVRIIKATIVK